MSMPSKVFITGANGFIGRALMARFRQLGAEVRGVDLQACTETQVCAGNVAQPGAWQHHAAGCELIIHTAAVVSNSATYQAYRDVSIGSVRHVVNAAIRAGATRLVHVSSVAAYGLDFLTDVDETAPITALSGYAYCDAKAASEHAALAAHAASEIACTVIRPGDVYGPASRPWVLIPLEMIRKRQFLLPAYGEGVFSPVYIDNLLDGIVAAATRVEGIGQIFNITDGQGIACRDFFAHHYRWLGKSGQPLSMSTPLAHAVASTGEWLIRDVLHQQTEISAASIAMLSRRASYSIAKARRLLGYQPSVDLSTGMSKTQAWLRTAKLI